MKDEIVDFVVCEPCADCGKLVPTQFADLLRNEKRLKMTTSKTPSAEERILDGFVDLRTNVILKMLDTPDEYGMYRTTRCFQELDRGLELMLESYRKEIDKEHEEERKICLPGNWFEFEGAVKRLLPEGIPEEQISVYSGVISKLCNSYMISSIKQEKKKLRKEVIGKFIKECEEGCEDQHLRDVFKKLYE